MTFSKKPSDFKSHTQVEVQEDLYWYDRPILFPMISDRGQELCILIADAEPVENRDIGDDIFASVLISEEDLKKFMDSKIDLRSAFEGEDKKPRVFMWQGDPETSIGYQDLNGPLPDKYLSDEGVYLDLEVTKAKRSP
ncbi:hypothetical protein [Sulfitobacter sp. R18_1]|uniref:hypothetical protein n=1 Tax=Sulfitobacter sp. R18_1 TaxID=2821104 RepID=UPI001ADB3981|nr:hypothetical protein [Sulfitobacter sp. R18_1]MBO9428765.1 hypothetical protein [Sulfitobacter sp. R18_1]